MAGLGLRASVRIEGSEARSFVVGGVAGDDGEVVATCGGCDEAIGHGHGAALGGEIGFLAAPDGGDTGVEAEDSTFHCFNQAVQPLLQGTLFGAVGQG